VSEPAAEPDEVAEPTLLTFPVVKRDRTNDLVHFQLDDDDTVLVANRPKQAALLNVAKAVGGLDDADELGAAGMLDDLLDKIIDADSAAYLRERFDDPDDDLDLDVLEPIMKQLIGLWYGRPTGRRPGSSGSPQRTGKRSTVRRRSGG
jgi:hypothetical protein